MHCHFPADSEATYQRLFEEHPLPLWVYDAATLAFLSVNQAAVALYGYARDEFLRMSLPNLRAPGDVPLAPDIPEKDSDLQPRAIYERHRKKDGLIISVEIIAHEAIFAGRPARFAFVREATVRERRVANLSESEERFKIAARATNDALWDWDLVRDLVWWSDGFGTSLGYTPGESPAAADAWAERIHPDDHDRVLASINQAITSGQPMWRDEYRIRRHDGSYAHVLDRGYVIHDEAGQPVRMVGGMSDISQKKQLEAQYLRAQRMESIGMLAGGIAHDLNNVLTPVFMSVGLLKGLTVDSHCHQLLNAIETSAQRGAALVQQVLSLARGTEGNLVPVRFGRLVTEIASMATETFPQSIQVTTTVTPDLWPVLGDATQLHQVLLNLAVNARDAMPHGGVLTFSAQNLVIDDDYISLNHEAKLGPYLLLEVTDSGLGIPRENLDRIFEPFFTTKAPGKGTGLGLVTVRTIVKNHGGFVTVDSEPDCGTTFKIYLPADQKLRASEGTIGPRELPHGQGELVLLVDDEVSVLAITQQTLEAFGYRVLTARNGAEAVEVYSRRAGDIAIVVTDTAMPVMDGQAEIDAILRINPTAKFIVASGLNANERNTAQNKGSAPRHFLSKPYSTEDLLGKLRTALTSSTRG